MNTFIALLRGINVGGKNILPMKTLVSVLESLGANQIQTYIQSGNVVFVYHGKDASLLSQQISRVIAEQIGFSPIVIVLSLHEFENAIMNIPFENQTINPTNLHIGFLDSKPDQPDLSKMESLKASSEQFQLIDQVFYPYAPMGIGRSRLATKAEKLLGVPMTDRNFRTAQKLLEIAQTQNKITSRKT